MFDSNRDFAIVQVSTGYDHLANSIVLVAGHGARLPDPATEGVFTVLWWNITDFRNPADDPNREWVRVTTRSVDTLTVTRGVDGTPATPKNLAGKTYAVMITYSRRKEGQLIEAARGSLFLFPHEQTTPNLTFFVRSGIVYVGGTRVVFAGGNSPTFTAPITNPRIDLLTINSAGVLERIAGTEATTPTIPAYPTDRVVICEVFNRVGQTTIRDVDTAGQGFIQRDVRPFLLREGIFTPTASGLVPASGGGVSNFLRADGAFAPPPPAGITSGWELIRTATFTNDINITGLDGNADRLWMLVVGARHTAAFHSRLRFNSDSGTNYIGVGMDVRNSGGMRAYGTFTFPTTTEFTFTRQQWLNHTHTITITPSTGMNRTVFCNSIEATDAANFSGKFSSGVWSNTTANITIINIITGAITSGEYWLFRRRA